MTTVQTSLFGTYSAHCFFGCPYVAREHTPELTHDAMESHYQGEHRADLNRLGYGDGSRMRNCTRCGAPAVMWSGAWIIGGAWIGWCSKPCQKAWIAGDKSAGDAVAKDVVEGGSVSALGSTPLTLPSAGAVCRTALDASREDEDRIAGTQDTPTTAQGELQDLLPSTGSNTLADGTDSFAGAAREVPSTGLPRPAPAGVHRRRTE